LAREVWGFDGVLALPPSLIPCEEKKERRLVKARDARARTRADSGGVMEGTGVAA